MATTSDKTRTTPHASRGCRKSVPSDMCSGAVRSNSWETGRLQLFGQSADQSFYLFLYFQRDVDCYRAVDGTVVEVHN
jgi:hypothetical protein